MQMEFAGRTAIVTGASRGIGRAIAMRLAAGGATVVLSARNTGALTDAVAELQAANGSGCSLALDLRLPDAPDRLVDFALQQTGRIDIVVNNAGAARRGPFLSLSDDDWTDGFALKFFGAVRLTRAAWPHLKRNTGSVLFIAGIGGRTPGPQFAIGGSVNAALLSLTKSLADTGFADGVRVNAINPGTIRTQRCQTRLDALAKETGNDRDAEQEYVQRFQIIRIGEPEDVGNLAAFVLGPLGTLLHGAIIDIDAGATKSL